MTAAIRTGKVDQHAAQQRDARSCLGSITIGGFVASPADGANASATVTVSPASVGSYSVQLDRGQ